MDRSEQRSVPSPHQMWPMWYTDVTNACPRKGHRPLAVSIATLPSYPHSCPCPRGARRYLRAAPCPSRGTPPRSSTPPSPGPCSGYLSQRRPRPLAYPSPLPPPTSPHAALGLVAQLADVAGAHAG